MTPLLLLALVAPPPTDATLEARLAPLIKAHKGKVAVAVKHLASGETFFHNADAVMPTASRRSWLSTRSRVSNVRMSRLVRLTSRCVANEASARR